jgi:polygalacturonase
MKVQISNNSLMTDIYVLNTPTHGIDIDGAYDSVFQRITVNNSLGDAPNAISGGKSAAHNTDGFNVGNVENIVLQDCKVWNQDDCVALSISNNVTIRNMYCSGTHGLSIAGGGTGPNQNITNVVYVQMSHSLSPGTDC